MAVKITVKCVGCGHRKEVGEEQTELPFCEKCGSVMIYGQIYIYKWGSDRDAVARFRKLNFKGRKCHLLRSGGMNSVLIRFLDNGEQLCTSLNSLKKYANEYPDNWDEIALRRKNEEAWVCERCHHEHDPETGYCITVHHLDGDKSNCEDWNLAVLCQRCHLHIQAKVDLTQPMLPGFEHSSWFHKHIDGYNRSRYHRIIQFTIGSAVESMKEFGQAVKDSGIKF